MDSERHGQLGLKRIVGLGRESMGERIGGLWDDTVGAGRAGEFSHGQAPTAA
eukprot:jgi/Botrbrau1/8951/Bobra.0148s0064.1